MGFGLADAYSAAVSVGGWPIASPISPPSHTGLITHVGTEPMVFVAAGATGGEGGDHRIQVKLENRNAFPVSGIRAWVTVSGSGSGGDETDRNDKSPDRDTEKVVIPAEAASLESIAAGGKACLQLGRVPSLDSIKIVVSVVSPGSGERIEATAQMSVQLYKTVVCEE